LKILFIAPSLEPGKDGVGDYTQRLAEALKKNGVTCYTAGWSEGAIESIVESDQSMRLPRNISEKEKTNALLTRIREWDPDWISLQWAPYGFHPKGFSLPLVNSLRHFKQGRRFHLMIHEIWLGEKNKSPWKEILVGKWQKRDFLQFVRRLMPEKIHTQAEAYRWILGQNRIVAERLALFGNIPVSSNRGSDASTLKAGFFGSIHPETELDAFVPPYLALGKGRKQKLWIGHAGVLNEDSVHRFDMWKQRWGKRIAFEQLGPLDPGDVSRYLQNLDLGLSANPLALCDTSGSIAAMLEHDLPVLNLRTDVQFKGFTPKWDPHHISTDLSVSNLDRLSQKRRDGALLNKPSVEKIGRQFLVSLQEAMK